MIIKKYIQLMMIGTMFCFSAMQTVAADAASDIAGYKATMQTYLATANGYVAEAEGFTNFPATRLTTMKSYRDAIANLANKVYTSTQLGAALKASIATKTQRDLIKSELDTGKVIAAGINTSAPGSGKTPSTGTK